MTTIPLFRSELPSFSPPGYFIALHNGNTYMHVLYDTLGLLGVFYFPILDDLVWVLFCLKPVQCVELDSEFLWQHTFRKSITCMQRLSLYRFSVWRRTFKMKTLRRRGERKGDLEERRTYQKSTIMIANTLQTFLYSTSFFAASFWFSTCHITEEFLR